MKTVKAAPSDLIKDDIHLRGEVVPVDADFVNSIVESEGPVDNIECWADKSGKLHVTDGYRRLKAVETAMEEGRLAPNIQLDVDVDTRVKNKKQAAEKSALLALSRKQHNRLSTAQFLYDQVYDANGKQKAKVAEVASKYGISPDKVRSACLVVKHAPMKVRIALAMEKITLSQALRLCNLAADKLDDTLREILTKNNPTEVEATIAAIERREQVHKRASMKKMATTTQQLAKGISDMEGHDEAKLVRGIYLIEMNAFELAMGIHNNWESVLDPMTIPGVRECILE